MTPRVTLWLIPLTFSLWLGGLLGLSLADTVATETNRALLTAAIPVYGAIGLALYLLGQAFLRFTGSLWPAFLAQSAPFLSMVVAKSAILPSPTPALIVATCVLLAATLKTAQSAPPKDHHGLILGVVVGTGAIFSWPFLVLSLVPVLLLDRRRFLLLLSVAILVAVLANIALPLSFQKDMGAPALTYDPVAPRPLPSTMIRVFSSKTVLSATLLAVLMVLMAYVRMRRRGLLAANPLARLAVGMVLSQVVTVALVAKYSAPSVLVPAVMLTGPSLAVLWHMTAQATIPANHRRLWWGIAVILATLTIPSAWNLSLERRSQGRDDAGRHSPLQPR